MTTPNPDGAQDSEAETLAQLGASETAIDQAAQGYATAADASPLLADSIMESPDRGQVHPYADTLGTLPTLPTLPTGFDWVVELREHKDSTNLTDHGNDDNDYDWNGWFWEDGRPICGHRHAIIFLRQNRVVLKQRTVQVEGLDTEWAFVTKIVEEAQHVFNEHDFDRRSWAATEFPNPSDVS